MNLKKIKICITTGDPDGIGLEVVSKALSKLKPQKNVYFYLWRGTKRSAKFLKNIDSCFHRRIVKTWSEAMATPHLSHKDIIDIRSVLPPPKWVEISAKACLSKATEALVTAPLSKTLIQKEGYKVIGHTELLQKLTKTKHLFMGFKGEFFNVLLVSSHIPLQKVSGYLTKEILSEAIQAALQLKKILPTSESKRPLALVGLNPHGGENGIIGIQEQTLLKPVLAHFRRTGHPIEGPLVPDAAFFKSNWKKYSVFVCPYHDQGLIPFKMIHENSGVHLTLGLPFIRTSVDHGTAKNIFGKNIANPTSMLEALKYSIHLSRLKISK